MFASPYSKCFSLPLRCRITQRKDFEQALSSSYLSNRWFAVYLRQTANSGPRLGMIVSKRIMPKAISRNYAKRLIREIFRVNIPDLPALDYVIKIRRGLTKDTSQEARSALLSLLMAAKVQ
ncbi:MAG TPA: ribonuclease P protein component [Candidatus Paceibacterota bacterium]